VTGSEPDAPGGEAPALTSDSDDGPSLAGHFRRLIASTGPISLAQFMAESNAHYYTRSDPLGATGDFVTAPEISQMFGELIGLWLADIWQRAGSPANVHYVELGPGRGTLARDALRAMAAFGLRPGVHLVEGSPALRERQASLVPHAHFHDDLTSLPAHGPLLLVANEFFDALPVRQLAMTAQGWREVMVACDDDGRFVPVPGSRPMDAAVPAERRAAPEGTLIETSPAAASLMGEVARLVAAQGGAALVVDYGYTEPGHGPTLQAVRAHKHVDPLAVPGEADLSAHVDFAGLAEITRTQGCRLLGTAEQGAWLRALGIDARAAALTRTAPDRADEIATARDRLVAPEQMGALFKVMGLAAPDWPDGAGFQG